MQTGFTPNSYSTGGPTGAQQMSPMPVQRGFDKQEEERPPSMVPLGMVVGMLALMFLFVLVILGVVADMHRNGVWRKDCPNM
mmetsp:Transcript_33776/g.81858  ORF Transcript_33776/g.81858 Transcript_33776/m.81858 type:complete len:82 (+) Transcript_33776:242-487(+)